MVIKCGLSADDQCMLLCAVLTLVSTKDFFLSFFARSKEWCCSRNINTDQKAPILIMHSQFIKANYAEHVLWQFILVLPEL